ncbi:MAG: thioredoxin domain-containing protein [archaeon]
MEEHNHSSSESSHEHIIEEKSTRKERDYKKHMSHPFWAVSTIVLVVIVIIILTTGSSASIISEEEAGQRVLDFALSQGAEAELVEVAVEGDFYSVVLSIIDQTGAKQDVPILVTKDGENLIPQLIPLTALATAPADSASTQQAQAQTDIPKSDKPEVELYVWAYCPYGVQAQGPLSEVANLLKDSADFKIVPYYDGHGAYETQQNRIQSCIQKLEADKYWDYASSFVADIYPKCSSARTEECDLTESTNLMKSLGIDSDAVLACVESDGEDLNAAASQQAQTNGVTGSPTIIINGVKANVARTSEAIKTAVCSAFNEAPEECSTVLASTSGTTPTGNC